MTSSQAEGRQNDSLDAIESKLKNLEKTLMNQLGSNNRGNQADQESHENNADYQQELNSTDEKHRAETGQQNKESAGGIKLSPKYQSEPVHRGSKKKRKPRKRPSDHESDLPRDAGSEEEPGPQVQTDEEDAGLHDDEMQEGASQKKDLSQVLLEQYAKLSEEIKLL